MILLIVTVVGLSLASANRTDFLMAGSYQLRAQTAEFAQSAIERDLAAGTPPTSGARHETYTDDDLDVEADVVSSYAAITEPPEGGVTMGEGFSAFHYRVRAEATGPRDTRVTLQQGYYVLGPGE